MFVLALLTVYLLVTVDGKKVVLKIEVIDCDDNAMIPSTNSSQAKDFKQLVSCQTESRRKKESNMMMDRIMPYMVIPFLISTAIIPFMLMSLKALLIKSLLVGKIAAILGILNMLRKQQTSSGQVTNSYVATDIGNKMSMTHYGYNGDEEYGAYINRKRRK